MASRATQRASAQRQRGRFAIVHNGIVENAAQLRVEASGRGRPFRRDGLGSARPSDRRDAGREARRIRARRAAPHRHLWPRSGRCTAARVDRRCAQWQPGSARYRRSRDVRRVRPAAFVRHTQSVVHLDDGEVAVVRADGYETSTLDGGATAKTPLNDQPGPIESFDKGDYAHLHAQGDRRAAGSDPPHAQRPAGTRASRPRISAGWRWRRASCWRCVA